jgi:hypothetical protein
LEELKKLESEILFMETGSSRMPYSYTEMNKHLMDAYDKACEKYNFIDDFHSRVKPVMLSEPMSYTHITGVYTFFTGEANINVNFPDYTIPFTAAHELAHQRGIAREDEANFVAFLVCIGSDDPYIRYCGYMNMYEYMAGALYKADANRYAEIYRMLCADARYEMNSYNVFFKPYKDSQAADVSETLNDAFLKGNGQSAGTASYSMVVDLAVAYIMQNTVEK